MKTVLIVDDSATIRNLVRVYLMGMDFTFMDAVNGQDALAAVDSQVIDLVIADVNMPVMDGLTFVRSLRLHADERVRRMPVVLLTSDKSAETRARGLAAGANAFVLKPVTSSNLQQAVRELLRSSK